jgi:hypothetical protein
MALSSALNRLLYVVKLCVLSDRRAELADKRICFPVDYTVARRAKIKQYFVQQISKFMAPFLIPFCSELFPFWYMSIAVCFLGLQSCDSFTSPWIKTNVNIKKRISSCTG